MPLTSPSPNRISSLFRWIAILMFVGSCRAQDRTAQEYQKTISPILDVLRSHHLSASLQYWGRCGKTNEPGARALPALEPAASNSATPLQKLRGMFASDHKMQVHRQPDGTIRMAETDAPQDLLDVRIAHLSFDDEPKKGHPMYSPSLAMNFILAAPEVAAFMKDHGIVRPPVFLNEMTSPEPHVSGELNNVTLAEALDYVLKTFPGLWLYETCPGSDKDKRVVVFAFYRTAQ